MSADETPPTVHRKSPLVRLLGVLVWIILTPALILATLLGALFLYFTPTSQPVGIGLAIIFALSVIAAFIFLKPRTKSLAVFAVLFGAVLVWYWSIKPSNVRNWQPDVAETAHADINGDQMTLHNVRNFHYRSETDYDQKWETRTYDLSKLRSLDTFFCYWGSPNIAHTMLSFNFDDGQHLCVSVETRKEVGESYGPVRSFFKQYELIYILADERDLVALRTNYRKEDVYLFPNPLPPDRVRRLLDDIIARANGLHATPEFYRTIRDNCTTSLIGHLDKVRDKPIPFSLSTLLNGWLPRVAYDDGTIPHDAPFEEMMKRYAITPKGQACGDGPEYSTCIRQGVGPTLNAPKS